MRKIWAAPFLLSGLLGAAVYPQSSDRPRPGLWENETWIKEITWGNLTGERLAQAQALKAQQQGKRTKSEECLTPEEASSEHAGISLGQGDCTFSRFEMAGGTLRALGKCTGGPNGDVTSIIGGDYTPTSMETNVDLSYEQPGQPGGIGVKLFMVRKRIGECPAQTNSG